MTGHQTLTTAVLIVGAGPTGLTLANILGQQGVDTILIDRKASTVAEPRAVSIDDESLRTMQAIGLADEVLKNVVKGYGVHYFTEPGGVCFGKVEPTASEYGFPRRNAFRQPLLEATLREGLERFACVTVLFGHTLIDFSQSATGVRVSVACPEGMKMIDASYVVGTDGGRSSVRQKIGSTLAGSSFKARWLVIDLENDDDAFWQTRAYCSAGRAVVEIPGPNRTRRFEFLLKPHESDEDALDPEMIRALLHPFKGDRDVDIVRKTVYTFHARVADRWSMGRVFIAGDAAHLTPPYAGQGMNSGVRDAHNLGWKLAAVINGMMSPDTLDSYEVERRDHAWALIRLALQLGFVMAPANRFSAWATASFFRITSIVPPVRDYFLKMKFKPKPRFKRGLVDTNLSGISKIVGTMAPQPLVKTQASSGTLLDDVLGHRYALVAVNVPGEQLRAVGELSLWAWMNAAKVLLCTGADAAAQGEGGFDAVRVQSLCGAYAQATGCFLLVRPDRYIAGVFRSQDAMDFARRYSDCLGIESRQECRPLAQAPHPQTVTAN